MRGRLWILCGHFQLFVLFPIMATRLAASDFGASAVFTTNGVSGLLFVGLSLVAFKWFSERRMLLLCYVALAILYGVAGLHESLAWLLFIVAAYTLVETLILPSIEAITAGLAHEGKQATVFGALALTWGVGEVLGTTQEAGSLWRPSILYFCGACRQALRHAVRC